MPSTHRSHRTVPATDLPNNTNKELDIYAAEFAKLVERFTPSRQDAPWAWLGRLPDEAFEYYRQGVSTFGYEARTPIKRRGRLYLIHTALLFMWMSWGKTKARQRFQSVPERGIRRAASLAVLECYKRGGVLARYTPFDWFFEPVGQWRVLLKTGPPNPEEASDPEMQATLREEETVFCTVGDVSQLVKEGALPRRGELSLS